RNGKIEVMVAIEVHRQDIKETRSDGKFPHGPQVAVSLATQHRERSRPIVRGHDVRMAIAVKVTGGDRKGAVSSLEGSDRREPKVLRRDVNRVVDAILVTVGCKRTFEVQEQQRDYEGDASYARMKAFH